MDSASDGGDLRPGCGDIVWGKGQRNEARVRFHTRTANTQRFNKVGPDQRRQQSTGSFKNET